MSFDSWWLEQTRKGDPDRNHNIIKEAFMAGWSEGYKEAEKDNRDAYDEGRWVEIQGDEYGSY